MNVRPKRGWYGTACLSVCVSLLFWGSTLQAEVAYDARQAQTAVEAFHASLVQALQTPTQDAREVLLAPQIYTAFHTGRIAQISLGRTWRGLSDEQQQTFMDLLSSLIVATYADRFDAYSGQHFVTDEVRPVQSGFVVMTRLLRDGQEDVALQYFLRDGRIFNVVADGVSDLSLRRADYNSIIKNEGYAALLAHIEQKVMDARSDG